MLQRVISIKNVGRFRDCAASGDVTFRRYTLVFAENARGKTTLAAVLRSLATGDPQLVLERHRLGAQHPPHIVLSHVPPRGVGDVPEDAYHRGFAAYRWLGRRLAPPLWIHGHSALSAVPSWRQDSGGTTFVNATGAVLIEIAGQ